MKKKLLFVIPALGSGGAEKSLINLLRTIDYNRYDVDLFLISHAGLFFNQLTKNVNVLPIPEILNIFMLPLGKSVLELVKRTKFKIALLRVKFTIINKLESDMATAEYKSWKILSQIIPVLDVKYNCAISFLEKTSNYFVIDKTIAEKKIGWVHIDYSKNKMKKEFDNYYFKELDYIFTVSEECMNILKELFSSCTNKIKLMYNISESSLIKDMAKKEYPFNKDYVNLVTVGRLNYQKGYDIAVEACKILIDKGYKIKWYVLGEGEEFENIINLIKERNLDNNFILLGAKENPYIYMGNCDIYVQTSRFEGKSIAIDEAMILAVPIVVTNFSTVKDQITNNEDGLIADMKAEDVAFKIIKLLENKDLKTKLIENLSNKNFNNSDEIKKLYKVIEN